MATPPSAPAPTLTWLAMSAPTKALAIMAMVTKRPSEAARAVKNAGVANDFVRLTDLHIHGNGHMVMIEKNNLDIARLIDEWLQKNVR